MALGITCGITFDIFKGGSGISRSQSVVSVVQRIEQRFRDTPDLCVGPSASKRASDRSKLRHSNRSEKIANPRVVIYGRVTSHPGELLPAPFQDGTFPII
jgi:hypothetical protein